MKRKQVFKKTLVTGLVAVIGLTLCVGCSKKDNADTIDNDGTELVKVDSYEEADNIMLDDGSIVSKETYEDAYSDADSVVDFATGELPEGWEYNPTNESDYKNVIDSINFSQIEDFEIKYNGVALGYPMTISALIDDGWVYSDESFDNEQAKQDNYSNIGVYTNKKYDNINLSLISMYYEDSDITLSGVSGRQDIIEKYGTYNMFCYVDNQDVDSIEYPQFSINDILFFELTKSETYAKLSELKNNSDEDIFELYEYTEKDIIDSLGYDSRIYYRLVDDVSDTEIEVYLMYKDDKCIGFNIVTNVVKSE